MELNEPDKEFILKIRKGDNEVIEERILSGEFFYIDENSRKKIIKHDTLVRLAQAYGFFSKAEEPILEFATYNNPSSFAFAHRCYGTLPNGDRVSEIGEANPRNLDNAIAQANPIVMSNKRAKDRLLIRIMGIADQVYSDSEIDIKVTSPAPAAKEQTRTVSNPSAKTENRALQIPIPQAGRIQEGANIADTTALPALVTPKSQEMTIESAKALIVDYGNFKINHKTLGEVQSLFPRDFEWLLTVKITERHSQKMKDLHTAALFLAEAKRKA